MSTDTQTNEVGADRHQRDLSLQLLNLELEERVRARTAELTLANEQLRKEIMSREALERELRLALDKEKELGELKDRIITTASHDFRTPLSVIISSVELLQTYGYKWDDPKKQQILQRITISANKLTGLVQDILVYNRVEAGAITIERAELDLSSFCQEMVLEFNLSAADGKTIRLAEYGSRQEAYSDYKLLSHVLSNLLSNALKYSLPGGQVELELIWREGNAIFVIRDSGIGIPLKDQARIFEPFHRAKNVGAINGTGLGLAIARRSAETLGATLTLESVEGSGTTATLSLPLKATTAVGYEIDFDLPDARPTQGKPEDPLDETRLAQTPLPHQSLLELTIDSSSSAVMLIDPTIEGNPIVYISRGFEKLTGFLRDEVLGRSLSFLEESDTDQDGLSKLQQAILEGKECQVVVRNFHKTGSLFWNEINLSPVRNLDGKVIYFICVHNDVTARVKTEEALHRSEQHFKALIENSPDLVARLDRKGNILYVNPTLERMSHGVFTSDAMRGKSFTAFGLSKQGLALFEQCFNQVLQSGEEASFEFSEDDEKGAVVYYHIRLAPEWCQENGTITSVLCVTRDVSKLIRSDLALVEAQPKLNGIFESISDGLITLNEAGRIAYLNRAAEDKYGLKREQVLGKPLPEVFRLISPVQIAEMLDYVLNEQAPLWFAQYSAELHKWFEVKINPLFDGVAVHLQNLPDRG